jgi:TRAP transporter 4TM/12TM fusion protein
MKSTGYSPVFAGAVEAVASNGGAITPPVMGVVAFLMAQMTGISYGAICLAAALPAILYYLAIYWQVDFRAAKSNLPSLPRDQLPSVRKTIKHGWPYIIPLVTLIVLIMIVEYSPEMSAIYSILLLAVVSAFRKETRLNLYRLITSFESAVKLISVVAVACALAGIVLGSLMGTGLGVKFSSMLYFLSGGNMYILLGLTAIACYVMGMGMGSISLYLILSALVAPALIKTGVSVMAAHLFVIYWGNISYISPPVCVSAFVAAGIANADPMKVGWQAVRLGIVSLVIPFMFIFEPTLLMIGTPAEIALTVFTSICGVILLAAGLEGYLFKSVSWWERVGLIAGGMLILYPGWINALIGAVLIVPILFYQIRAKRLI